MAESSVTITNSLARFGGYKIIQSPLMEPDYVAVRLPPLAKNRSRRLIKKLMQKVRQAAAPVWTSVIVMKDPLSGRDLIVCHPSVYAQLGRAGV